MNARELLQIIESRGGVAIVKTDESGAAFLNVAPRTLSLELLPEIQRFKPALLELLGDSSLETPSERAQTSAAPNDGPTVTNGPQNRNLTPYDAAEIPVLARVILECIRPNGGFDFGKVKPFWRAANRLTGQNMTSPELATWARGVLGGETA